NCRDRSICDEFPPLCDGDIPLWPFLFFICAVEPEICAGLACLLDPWACLPCWPFCDEPEKPERPESKCDAGQLLRGLAKCEMLEHLIDRLCGTVATASSRAGSGMPATALPAMAFGPGGGFGGLMARDRARQQQLMTPVATRPKTPKAAAACDLLRKR